MVFALVYVLTAAFGRLFRTIWFYSLGYGIKIHNFMFLLTFYIVQRYVLPCFDSAKVFPISQSIGRDRGGFSLLSAQFGLFDPLQGQKFADGRRQSALQGGLIAH